MNRIVLAIITNPERNLFYLQLKDDTYHVEELRNTYTFFGGGVEEGEEGREALRREMYEELELEAAELIERKAKFISKEKMITRYGPHKGNPIEYTIFESILSQGNLEKIAKLPIKEGEKGSLIKKVDLKNTEFNFGKILDRYFELI